MHSTSRSASHWETGQQLSLPTLEGDHSADVCVIGLGGSGLVCARELARLGLSVIGLDAGTVGAGAGGRNGGFLLAGISSFYHDAIAAHGHARARAMYQGTLDEIDRIEADTPGIVSRTGSLRIADSPEEAEDCSAHLTALQRDGFAADAYTGPEGEGLLLRSDGVFQPLDRCEALARAASAEGVCLHAHSQVVALGHAHAETSFGRVRATHVIVAADGGLETLLPELTGDVRTARLQMLATAPTSEVQLTRPVYARWGYDYWRQLPDRAVVLGGARDVGGDAEWTHETCVSSVVQAALERQLRDKIGVKAPVRSRWAASVSYTRDQLPIIREVRQDVWAIGGYSGTGNVVGSLLGRGLARLIAHDDASLLAPFVRPPTITAR